MKQPKKILVIRTDRIGDAVLSTPVIKNLKTAFPNAYIAFMCRPYTKPALEGNPDLNEIIIYDKDKTHKSVWQTLKFAYYLSQKKFDWAILLHPTNRTHLIAFLAGIPVRVGWDKKLKNLLTIALPHLKQKGDKHEAEYNLDLIRALGIKTDDLQLHFPISIIADKKVTDELINAGINIQQKFIVFHPVASDRSKQWPAKNFSSLAKLLIEKTGLPVIIMTGPNEKEAAQMIIDQNPKAIDFRGNLNVSEMAALLKRASLFIGNDSGPGHIAAAVGTPVISIFGSNDKGMSPNRWRPLGKKTLVIHNPGNCQPCQKDNCLKNFNCLASIPPESVFSKALEMLR